MKKETKRQINSGNTLKFGLNNPRSLHRGYIVKHMISKPRVHDGNDFEANTQAIHKSVGQRVGDGGLLEDFFEQGKGRERERSTTHRDVQRMRDHGYYVEYSLNKRKRWNIVPAVAKEINDIFNGSSELDQALPKHMISMVEKEVFNDSPSASYSYNDYNSNFAVSGYHDSQVGHLKPKQGLSYEKGLRKKGEELLKNKVAKSGKAKEKKPGHNQHFRGVQRKVSKVQRHRLIDEASDQILETLPEVRYEVVKEKPKDSHRCHSVSMWGRSYFKRVPSDAQGPLIKSRKALSKRKGTNKAGHGKCQMLRQEVNDAYMEMDNWEEDSYGYIEEMGLYEESQDEDPIQAKFWNDTTFDDDLASATNQSVTPSSLKPSHLSDYIIGKTKRSEICSNVNLLSGAAVKKNGVVFMDNDGEFEYDYVKKVQYVHKVAPSRKKRLRRFRHEQARERTGDKNNQKAKPSTNSPTIEEVSQKSNSFDYSKCFDKFPKSFKVRLTCDSIQPKSLRHHFGDSYQEGSCLPRKFNIILKENNNSLGVDTIQGNYQTCNFGSERPYSLLFECTDIEEGLNCLSDKESNEAHHLRFQTLSVRMEGNENTYGLEQIFAEISRDVTSVGNLVRFILSKLVNTEYFQLNAFGNNKNIPETCSKLEKFDMLKSMCSWRTDVFALDQARAIIIDDDLPFENKVVKKLKSNTDTRLHGQHDRVCGICFDDIATVNSSALNGLTMQSCNHWFCVQCWRQHLYHRIMRRDMVLQCPGYKCGSVLDDVTMLSLMSYTMYNKHWALVQDTKIERSTLWQWCPNNRCQRLTRATTAGKDPSGGFLVVECACQKFWCFDCQREAHWPASCQAYSAYVKFMEDEMARNQLGETIKFVMVKKCPRCKHPINKNGGCRYMTCICGLAFCWQCLIPISQHDFSCKGAFEETAVHFEDIKSTFSFNAYLYNLALQCRRSRKSRDYLRVFRLIAMRSLRWKRTDVMFSVEALIHQFYKEESRMVAEMKSFIYQALHVAEFCLAALSTFPKKTLSRQLQKVLDLMSVIDFMDRILMQNPIKGELASHIQRAYQLLPRATIRLECVSRNVLKTQELLKTGRTSTQA